MKIIKQYIKRNVADETLLVPIGDSSKGFNGMITLRGVGEFIWDNIENVTSFEDLVSKILDEYDIDEETARTDAREFISCLLKAGMVAYTQVNW